MTAPDCIRIFGESHRLADAADWHRGNTDALAAYHLHYFDDLTARDADQRRAWHSALIERWVAENPVGRTPGWDPYPLSRRLVNWIRATLNGAELSPQALDSLACQARWLAARVEWHLLGNHVLANAKALLFAGAFFAGPEADTWRLQGQSILQEELPRQILRDGGHVERSPMYQALVLEDLLDLHNLALTFPDALARSPAAQYIPDMASWLYLLTDPQGLICQFNDAAEGMALSPAALVRYQAELGLGAPAPPEAHTATLTESGYARLARGPALALVDLAPLGPDYQPGHGHADTLTFQLYLHSQPLVVDPGTGCYGLSAERLRQRGTRAHNTLSVDGTDSSEVWGGFRVGRRARPFAAEVTAQADAFTAHGAHDGFAHLPGRIHHHRSWHLAEDRLVVTDSVTGQGQHRIDFGFLLHPAVRVARAGPHRFHLVLPTAGATCTLITDHQAEARLEDASHSPAFGSWLATQRIGCATVSEAPARFVTEFHWSPST